MQAAHWDPSLRNPLLEMQFAAQEAQLLQADEVDDGIVLDGSGHQAQPIGRIVILRRTGEIHVAQIALLPQFRGRGIGTHLLTDLQRQARAGGVPLRLYCRRTNSAVRLYHRLGFVASSDDAGAHVLLTWFPEHVRQDI